jgi:PrcB C-terminal
VVLAGCGAAERTIAFRDISSELRGFQPPRLTRDIFTSRDEFADYLRSEDPGADISIPPIDWAHRSAVVVAAGPRSSSGYVLHVTSVRETTHHVVVSVHEDAPTLGDHVVPDVTYPFRLITIPRTSKPLVLHWPGRG